LAAVLEKPVRAVLVVGEEALEEVMVVVLRVKMAALLLKGARVAVAVENQAKLVAKAVVTLEILVEEARLARPRQQLQAQAVMGAQALVVKAVAVAVAVVLLQEQEVLAVLVAFLQVAVAVADGLIAVPTQALVVLAAMVCAASTLGKE
jgi:hypothetical protein